MRHALAYLLSLLAPLLATSIACAQSTSQASTQAVTQTGTQIGKQDAVRLLASTTITPNQQVTLAHIATIEGSQASLLSSIVIRESANPGDTISLADIRAAMRAQKGLNAGRIALSGSSVTLTAPSQPAPTPAKQDTTATTATANQLRIRDAIPDFLAREYNVAPTDLQLTFDDSDTKLLDTPLTNRTYTLAPQGTSDRVPIHVRIYEGDTLIAAQTTRVAIKIQREVLIAALDISRGTPLDDATTTRERRWMPFATRVGDPTAILGRMAKSTIRAGSLIETRQTEEAIVIRKGDLVAVDCLAGSVVLRSQMRAKTDGRVGEFIDLVAVTPPKTAKSGKKSRDAQSRAQPTIIRARVAGPGRAVTTTDTSASQLRDGSQPTDELGNTSDARSAPDSSGTDAAPPSPSSPRGKQPGKRTIVLPLRPASDAPREDPRP
jgi:flagella basal body P-ring formation protein FlgA